MCIPLMQKHGLADRDRDLQLRGEGGALRVRGRQIPKVVESAFADRDHIR